LPDLRRSDLPACRFATAANAPAAALPQPLPPLDAGAEHGVACWHPLAREPAHA
jgi:hypothetical protein